MSIQTIKLALEAFKWEFGLDPVSNRTHEALKDLRQAIAQAEQPKFIKHIVEDATDWSEWVCPDPKSYLMKCCDCGLVHEAQFGVVRYKSETEREDCDKVDDPNLQAVFRMRRHEAWEPEDTAHRAGGLPMEQAQPVAWADDCRIELVTAIHSLSSDFENALYAFRGDTEARKSAEGSIAHARGVAVKWNRNGRTTPPQRKPLSDEEIMDICASQWASHPIEVARAIEAAHGIKENT